MEITSAFFSNISELSKAIEAALRDGIHKTAAAYNIKAEELMESFRESYNSLCKRNSLGGEFTVIWEEWAEIDPKYEAPHIAMAELCNLIDCFAIGVSAQIDAYAHLSGEDVLTKAQALANMALARAESVLAYEIMKGADIHKAAHIEALATSFIQSIKAIITFACNPFGDSAKAKEFRGCKNLCGPVESDPELVGIIAEGAKAAPPARCVKRHGIKITLNELADSDRTNTSDLKYTIGKVMAYMKNSRSDKLISAAQRANIKTAIRAQKPKQKKGRYIEWYSEDMAVQYLKKQSMDEVRKLIPPAIMPKPVINEGVDWYTEEQVEMMDDIIHRQEGAACNAPSQQAI